MNTTMDEDEDLEIRIAINRFKGAGWLGLFFGPALVVLGIRDNWLLAIIVGVLCFPYAAFMFIRARVYRRYLHT
jgi:hypothetical protein